MKSLFSVPCLVLLITLFCQEAYSQGLSHDDFFQVIRLYQDGRYDIVISKFKNQGFNVEKYTPDYELDGVKYLGDFSLTLRRNVFYQNNSTVPPQELIKYWTFKTREYPSHIEFDIEFKFEDYWAPELFKSLKETWRKELGEPDTSCGLRIIECAEFVDKRTISGKNIEKANSLITLLNPQIILIKWEDFFSATKVVEGDLEYRRVKFPIDQSQEEYFQNQSHGEKQQSLPLKRKGSLYVLELRIGGKNLEYIIDSGASDMNISPSTENYLKDLGVIRSTDYLKSQTYTLADGSQKEYRRLMIPKILLAGAVIENVSASVNEDNNHPLLLGKSFLDKFSYWKIDNDKLTVEFRVK